METPVELKIGIGSTQITSNQLLRLKVGDIITLDTDIEQLLPCTVEGVTKYWGIPGIIKANKAFQIVSVDEPRYS